MMGNPVSSVASLSLSENGTLSFQGPGDILDEIVNMLWTW